MNYLVCYDIADNRRLSKIAKVLEKYGHRVQYSFFEVDTSDSMLETILDDIKELMEMKEDKLYVYPICTVCKEHVQTEGDREMLDLLPYIIL